MPPFGCLERLTLPTADLPRTAQPVRLASMTKLHLAQGEAANDFLAEDPLGILVGMLLDQRIR